MYLCLDCGRLFEEPKRYVETHGLDSPPYEMSKGCPDCGGAYVETMECCMCDEWITGEYIELADGSAVCEECYMKKDIAEEA